MILRDMPELETAIDAESYEYLSENAPTLLRALQSEISTGASADEIKHYVMAVTGRYAIALRCQQAARHIRRETTQ
jgi:hypothetical protein